MEDNLVFLLLLLMANSPIKEVIMGIVTMKREPPISTLSHNPKVRLQVQREYYESKIKCLMDMNLPMKLVLLACWDSPVEREKLNTRRGQMRFIKKCLKYYTQKLKEIEKEERRLKA